MKIEHIALWAKHKERIIDFYVKYFNAAAGEIDHNLAKRFKSCFLTLPAGGARLEVMSVPDLVTDRPEGRRCGYCHIAISLGSREAVNRLTEEMRRDGVTEAGEPRVTGDGYYESFVLDPEGNLIELTE